MTIPTNDEVREYLLSLGNTPNQVAETLQAQSIKGSRASADSCPIAQALNSHYGEGVQAFVTHTDVTLVYDSTGLEIVNPLQIADFISLFDSGKYPELDKEYTAS